MSCGALDAANFTPAVRYDATTGKRVISSPPDADRMIEKMEFFRRECASAGVGEGVQPGIFGISVGTDGSSASAKTTSYPATAWAPSLPKRWFLSRDMHLILAYFVHDPKKLKMDAGTNKDASAKLRRWSDNIQLGIILALLQIESRHAPFFWERQGLTYVLALLFTFSPQQCPPPPPPPLSAYPGSTPRPQPLSQVCDGRPPVRLG
jgi:hypothetical protein